MFRRKGLEHRANRLGWVTSLNVDFGPPIDITSYGSPMPQFIVSKELLVVNLEMRVPQTEQVMTTLHGWMNDGIGVSTFVQEWRCLYCTSTNSIERTHCSQCGAPRNFILG